MTDSTGAAAASYSHNPYGKTTASSGSMASVNNYRYASGYTDGTGLNRFGARYYNPTLARFTQPDPSGQEANNYAYAGDDPIAKVDPTGLFSLKEIAAGVGLVATAVFAVATAPVSIPVAAGVAAVGAVGAGSTMVLDGAGAFDDGDVIDGDPTVGCYDENECI